MIYLQYFHFVANFVHLVCFDNICSSWMSLRWANLLKSKDRPNDGIQSSVIDVNYEIFVGMQAVGTSSLPIFTLHLKVQLVSKKWYMKIWIDHFDQYIRSKCYLQTYEIHLKSVMVSLKCRHFIQMGSYYSSVTILCTLGNFIFEYFTWGLR